MTRDKLRTWPDRPHPRLVLLGVLIILVAASLAGAKAGGLIDVSHPVPAGQVSPVPGGRGQGTRTLPSAARTARIATPAPASTVKILRSAGPVVTATASASHPVTPTPVPTVTAAPTVMPSVTATPVPTVTAAPAPTATVTATASVSPSAP